MNAAEELRRLAELFENIAGQYSKTDIAESQYFAGVVSAHTYCAQALRERAYVLDGREPVER